MKSTITHGTVLSNSWVSILSIVRTFKGSDGLSMDGTPICRDQHTKSFYNQGYTVSITVIYPMI